MKKDSWYRVPLLSGLFFALLIVGMPGVPTATPAVAEEVKCPAPCNYITVIGAFVPVHKILITYSQLLSALPGSTRSILSDPLGNLMGGFTGPNMINPDLSHLQMISPKVIWKASGGTPASFCRRLEAYDKSGKKNLALVGLLAATALFGLALTLDQADKMKLTPQDKKTIKIALGLIGSSAAGYATLRAACKQMGHGW